MISSIKEVVNYSKSKLELVLHPDPSFEVMVPAERISSFKKWMNS
ncbi:hypothetical protein R9C00_09645 [Flammeovirgaceae bacterium SG7u.111]|nr:hypothetical protein [Flammeovirgaceae bacterium SG7u.132]WPO37713.1 hypothetical protein R9C00_09645 [Flammeovirgaceae bacterium SG7u.111]